MCLLIQLNGAFPPLEILEAGQRKNSDGIGIAYPDGDKVRFHKGISFDELLTFSHLTSGLIHFRMASIGKVSKQLCHPFPVGRTTNLRLTGRTKQVLAHNGHWSDWYKVLMNNLNHFQLPQGEYSDTRAMALLASIHGESFLNLLNEKIVLLSATKSKRFGRGWIKREGFYMSNDPLYVYQSNYYSKWNDENFVPGAGQELANYAQTGLRARMSNEEWFTHHKDEQDLSITREVDDHDRKVRQFVTVESRRKALPSLWEGESD